MSRQMKFCANLNFLFQEKVAFCDRLVAAKNAGFQGVEAGLLYDESVVDIHEYARVKESCNLQQILINSYPGNVSEGDFGLLAVPGREKDFEEAVTKTLRVAEILHCKKVHFLSGKIVNGQDKDLYYTTMEMNLKKLHLKLQEKEITALIEPINNYTLPDYFLSNFDTALSLLKSLKSPWIRLQVDIFHLQQIHGNLTQRLKEFLPFIGHIQIAQVPGRGEPNTPGEIDYKYILDLINELGYSEWIGLEYSPFQGTEKGLDWIPEYGFKF